jgi:uncharacterized protein YndB with AHSA1/START domain
MQTLNCTLGHWTANAQVEEVESGKLLAIISVTNDHGDPSGESKHTVVFEHTAGSDRIEETRSLVQRLLQARYST